jgi:hypothetical protein
MTLAPTVVVSKDTATIKHIVEAVGSCQGVHCIMKIDAENYKRMRSLYDNLREAEINAVMA